MKKISILFLTFIALFLSCTSTQKPKTHLLFDGLTGSWQLENKPLVEQWSRLDDHLAGIVFLVRGADTVITETLKLFDKEENLYYEATVPDQNEGKPILFQMVDSGKDFWIFENMEHDFPNRISYRFLHADTLLAKTEGETDAGWKSIEFRYFRLKN